MSSPTQTAPRRSIIPGVFVAIVLALVAFWASPYVPFLGRNMTALLLGLALANSGTPLGRLAPGIRYTEKTILAIAIALLGTSLSPQALFAGGASVLGFVLVIVVSTIAISLIIGRLFRLPSSLAILLGIGNAVCGVSAIVASASVLRSSDRDKAMAIAAVNIWGTLGMFLLPTLLSQFGQPDVAMGSVIGGSLQAVGQVAAAGYAVNDAVGEQAVLIKMSRILLLIPLLLVLNRFSPQQNGGAGRKLLPPHYLTGFIVCALLAGFFPNSGAVQMLRSAASGFLLVAMAGLGMSLQLRDLKTGAVRALLAGGVGFVIQIAIALGLSLR